MLRIPPGELLPGKTYSFEVALTFKTTNEFIKAVSFSVTGAPIKIEAVASPATQLMAEDSTLTITSDSYDRTLCLTS